MCSPGFSADSAQRVVTRMMATQALRLWDGWPARAVAASGSLAALASADGKRKAKESPSAREDAATVRECLGGNKDAYRRLVERYQARVSAIMWRFSRDMEVHRDLVQDVFVSAYESLARFRGQAPFEHWLARIATNTGYGYWRRQRRAGAISTVPLEECAEMPEEIAETLDPQEAGALLHRLLEQLPARDRLVLTLRYVEARNVSETAELTGWSETMVKVQAWRARRKLEALFKRACPEVAP